MAPRLNALDMIASRESGWRNIKQNIVPSGGGFNPSTGTITGPSSAGGYFQMIDPTWRSAAKSAGIDTSQYPTAMSAPYDVQRQAANSLFKSDGFSPWAPYNAGIRSDIAAAGGAGAFGSDDVVPSNAPEHLRGSNYTPGYDNFSPSGYDYSGDQAPGSFSDTLPTNVPYENFSRQDNSLTQQEGSFTTFGGVNGHFQPGSDLMTGNPWSTDKNQTDAAPVDTADTPSSTIENASYIKGDSVTDPKAASQGQGTDVPTAIVTAANQEAKTTAAAAKTTAEATLNATKTQTASDAKLQGEQQGWAANWAVRIFLFIVGAIFLGGALFLFGGQAMFSKSTA